MPFKTSSAANEVCIGSFQQIMSHMRKVLHSIVAMLEATWSERHKPHRLAKANRTTLALVDEDSKTHYHYSPTMGAAD